jgi:predicted DNA-binding protein with PD1-like motif
MYKREGNFIIAKFVDGEIIENLKKLCKEEKIDSAFIINGIGMIEDALIGYFDGEKYIKERIHEPVELISLQGNICMVENDYLIHAHVVLGKKDHNLKGGHLFEGKVKIVNEIIIYALEKIKIKRRKKGEIMEMEL